MLPVDFHDILFGHIQLNAQPGLLSLKLDHPGAGGLCDNPHLDGFQHIRGGFFIFLQLLLQRLDLEVIVVLFPVFDRPICHPFNDIVGQAVHFDGLRYGRFNDIPADVLLVTGVLGAPFLAGVVVMQLSISAGSRYARHVAATVSAAQFPGQQIIFCPDTVPGSNWVLFHPHGLLYPVPQIVTHYAWNAINHPDIPVYVDAPVPLVLANTLEAAFVPVGSLAGLDALGIEISRNVHEQVTSSHTGEYFPHNGRIRFIQHHTAILTPLVAQGLPTVCHALAGVIIQPPGDVLCHVLAVKLVDVHHVPQCKTPGGSIVKIFLGIKHLYAVIVQLRLVDHCLKHIAADAVRLPRHDGLKLPFFSIPHHLLETRPVIRLAADCPVLIGSNDVQPQLGSVLHALADLLLNADLSLVMGGVAGIDDGILTRSDILFSSHQPSPSVFKSQEAAFSLQQILLLSGFPHPAAASNHGFHPPRTQLLCSVSLF